MKKTIFTLSFFLWFATTALAQNWEWARSINGIQDVQVSTVTIDSQNNIYIAGTKQGTVHFSDTDEPVVLTGANVNTQYMAKYTSQGTLLWAVGLGGETQGNITHLHIDSNGDLFVAGSFQSNATTPFTVRGTGDFEVDLEAVGGFDAFYAKYNADGELYWAHSAGSPAADRLQGISTNISGDIATVGFWRGGTLKLAEDIEFNYEGTKQNGFFALHNEDGSVKSALQFAGEWVRLESGVNSCLNEGFISAINFQQNLILPNGQELISGGSKPSDYQQVLIKINNDAEIEWYIQPETTASMYGPDAIATDSEGFTYFAGRFTKETTFPSYNSDHSITMPPIGIVYTGFLAKYDKLGYVIWVKTWGGNAEVRTNWVSENNGIITVAGHSFGNFTINDDTGLVEEVFNPGGKHEGFAINFDSDGNILGTIQIEGNLQNDALTCVVDNDQNTIIGGAYQSNPLTIGEFSLYNEGGNDAFLAKHINFFARVRVSHIKCHGDNDGVLTIDAIQGGTPPYKYAIAKVLPDGTIDTPFDEGEEFEGLKEYNGLETGKYALLFEDADGNKVTRYYVISEPDELVVTPNISDIHGCFGEQNGDVELIITGGTGETTTFWDTENGYGLVPTSQNQGSLAAGTYSYTVTDENGCVTTANIEITQPARISFETEIIGNTAHSEASANGSIELTVNNATDPVDFSWKGPNNFTSTNQNINNIRGGTYVLQVEDANGCMTTENINVPDENLLNVSIDEVINPKCKGGSDGYITISIENYMGGLTIRWEDEEGNSLNDSDDKITASNLKTGIYSVTVVDDMGTPYDESDDVSITLTPIFVEEPLFALEAKATVLKTTCPYDNDGEILLTVNGCSYPYTIEWTTSDGSGIQPNERHQSGLTVGSYTYEVTDSFGCYKTSSVNLQSNYSSPSFSVDAFPSESVCEGTEVIVEVTSGYLYQFTIDDVPQAEPSYNTSFNIENPVDGMRIKVTAWNTAGCSSESEEIVLSVTQNVGTPQFIAGRETLFSGTTEIYTALAENAQSIEYSIVGGTATVDSETGEVTNIEEDFTIRATAYGYNGCGEEFTDLSVSVIKAYNVTFSVVNNNSEPLEDVTITIEDFSPITTDIQGAASTLLPNGIYNFIASSAQFDDYIDLFEVDGEDTTVDIILTIVGNTGVDAIGIAPYPNPFDSEIYLSSPESVKRVVIMNIAGQTLLDIQPNGINRINTSSIMPGLYIINITSVDGHMSIHKLIKE